ncbi:MAG: hypothetical protein WCS94_03240 [Verrucomicrobiota bacterium]
MIAAAFGYELEHFEFAGVQFRAGDVCGQSRANDGASDIFFSTLCVRVLLEVESAQCCQQIFGEQTRPAIVSFDGIEEDVELVVCLPCIRAFCR